MKCYTKQEIREAMCLYAVTDSMWLKGRALPEVVEEALRGGATFIQIREKELSYDDFLIRAAEVKKITDKYGVPYVVNDEVEIAKAVHADGVHIGQSDKALTEARMILGSDKIIGVSVQTVEQALEAERNSADYLGVGSVFTTSTKADAEDVSLEMLREICDAVSIPVVAIGGITGYNIVKLGGTHVDGVAVVSAIFAAENIERDTAELLAKAKQLRE
ncbi:MAG: thiamine phosphate synthase [Bacteroidales bacterium]|nr:thiamine phosphate synthase [Bacteroidales bacterium]